MAMGVAVGPLTLAGALLSGALLFSGRATSDAIAIGVMFCVMPLIFGLGVLTLQRWNLNGQAIASGGLLAACLGAVFVLSSPEFLSFLDGRSALDSSQIVSALVECFSFVGLVISVVMTPIVIVEVLLRWASGGGSVPVSEETFLVMRWVGSLLIVSVGSVIIREEGLSRLLDILAAVRM
jgi:hypothetical protein